MNNKDSKAIKKLNEFGLHKDEKSTRDKEQSPSTANVQSPKFIDMVKKQKN